MIQLFLILTSLYSHPSFAGPGDLDYFKKFLFVKENISTDPDFPNIIYHYLMFNELKFKDASGNSIISSGSIQMFEDGHFVSVYREMKEMVFPGSPAGSPPMLFPNGCKTFTGQWSVPDTNLILSLVGSGTRDYLATQYPPEGVKITFDQDYLSKGLKGQAVTYFYGQSNTPDEASMCF